jgi:hypothetical protein
MDNWRVTIATGHCYTAADAETLLASTNGLPSDLAPAVEEDRGTVSVSLSIKAEDAETALDFGARLIGRVFGVAGIEEREALGLEVERE